MLDTMLTLFIEGIEIDDNNEITCFLFFYNNRKRVKIHFTIIFNIISKRRRNFILLLYRTEYREFRNCVKRTRSVEEEGNAMHNSCYVQRISQVPVCRSTKGAPLVRFPSRRRCVSRRSCSM